DRRKVILPRHFVIQHRWQEILRNLLLSSDKLSQLDFAQITMEHLKFVDLSPRESSVAKTGAECHLSLAVRRHIGLLLNRIPEDLNFDRFAVDYHGDAARGARSIIANRHVPPFIKID